MSCDELGLALGLSGSHNQVRKRVLEYESGRREISGPIERLLAYMLADRA